MEPEEIVATISSFIKRVEIPLREEAIEEPTFLPGLCIDQGVVILDRGRLTYPGDLLHEAGHVALTHPNQRSTLSQEVLGRKSPQESEEIGVILWTYLAATHIGLSPEVVFHAGGYKGQSDWLLEQFSAGVYIGLPLLVWMGVAENPKEGERPLVLSWLRTRGE